MLLINKKKRLTMTLSLKDFAQAVCEPAFRHDCPASWDDLLLPLDFVIRCPESLSSRGILNSVVSLDVPRSLRLRQMLSRSRDV